MDKVSRAQHAAVYSWSCGNSDRTCIDQDKIDRLAWLITKVQLETVKDGKGGQAGREGHAGKAGTDDDDLE